MILVPKTFIATRYVGLACSHCTFKIIPVKIYVRKKNASYSVTRLKWVSHWIDLTKCKVLKFLSSIFNMKFTSDLLKNNWYFWTSRKMTHLDLIDIPWWFKNISIGNITISKNKAVQDPVLLFSKILCIFTS